MLDQAVTMNVNIGHSGRLAFASLGATAVVTLIMVIGAATAEVPEVAKLGNGESAAVARKTRGSPVTTAATAAASTRG